MKVRNTIRNAKSWRKSLIVFSIAFPLVFLFGEKRQAIVLAAIYLVTIPFAYVIEKKELALWQKRLIGVLIVHRESGDENGYAATDA